MSEIANTKVRCKSGQQPYSTSPVEFGAGDLPHRLPMRIRRDAGTVKRAAHALKEGEWFVWPEGNTRKLRSFAGALKQTHPHLSTYRTQDGRFVTVFGDAPELRWIPKEIEIHSASEPLPAKKIQTPETPVSGRGRGRPRSELSFTLLAMKPGEWIFLDAKNAQTAMCFVSRYYRGQFHCFTTADGRKCVVRDPSTNTKEASDGSVK